MTHLDSFKTLNKGYFYAFSIHMTDHKQQLQSQLWKIANDLLGNMGADEFRDYILGFTFFKYLSEKVELWADGLLTTIATLLISLGIRVW